MKDILSVPSVQQFGLGAFDALRAEDEPWLAACYVPPAEFALMVGARAALIFGEVGSGKTALRLALERAWQDRGAKAAWLLVRWQFNALVGTSEELSGSPLAARQQLQVFDAITRGVLAHLGQQPALWRDAPAWVRTTLAWFTRRFLAGDPETYIESLVDDGALPELAAPVMREIMAAKGRDLLSPDAPPVAVMAELARALPRVGLSGVRVVMEDVEPWWEAHPARLTKSLEALLSTLALFEHPAFAYTFLLPAGLWPGLSRTTGVVRRRVQVFQLRFQEPELVRSVERRLALALGRAEATLADLGPTDNLRAWFTGCGGTSPRGWLETTRPFLAAYLAHEGSPQPLTAVECHAIQMRHPPLLWLEQGTSQVTVGWRRVTGLSSGQFAILRCLSDHAGEICSRKALYQVYQRASDERYREEGILTNSDIAGTLDSALYRLRTLIEPFPETPILLETKKGQGMRLRFPARD